MLRRTKAETNALIHDQVTEIYQITEGSGTLVTGGSLEGATATDLTRLNAGMSHTGVHRGGESRRVKVNDVISVKNNNVSKQLATKGLETSTSRACPDWLSLNKEELKGTIMRIPTREEIQPIANVQAVVEFYSR